MKNHFLPEGMTASDITCELYREYDLGDRIYRINNPKTLYLKKGSTAHRVEDIEGVVHYVTAPGHNGCVLRWKQKEGAVSF